MSQDSNDLGQTTIGNAARSSRRAVLAAALGGVGAWVASALGRPAPAAAVDYVYIGGSFAATSNTSIHNGANDIPVLSVTTSGASMAVEASSAGGYGLYGGSGTSAGVYGASASGNGVYGVSDGAAAGVFGIATAANAAGVEGHSTKAAGVIGFSKEDIGVSGYTDAAALPAVRGWAAASATGVYGYSGPHTPPSPAVQAGVDGVADSTYGVGVQGRSPTYIGVAGSGPVFGVLGSSSYGVGVAGTSTNSNHPAVLGHQQANGTGIEGFSGGGANTPAAPKAKTGVYGHATQDSNARGVWGYSTSGQGVRGEATTGAGIVGIASSAAGYALKGSGRLRFDKVSGLATLAAGTTSKTITPGTDVTTESFVLLTPMADIGTRRLWFTRDTTANTITIRLSSSLTTSTSISWLLLR